MVSQAKQHNLLVPLPAPGTVIASITSNGDGDGETTTDGGAGPQLDGDLRVWAAVMRSGRRVGASRAQQLRGGRVLAQRQ